MYGSTGSPGTGPLGGWTPPEVRAAQERAAKAKRVRIGLITLGAVALLVAGMVINPPTGTVHSFTEASNYNSERESGCVNSGEGCHGDETKFTDFNAYHPDAACTTCHDYQGAACIPCHAPKEHECSTCHDGTMEAAPDRVRITDPYPRGHYRESTHTAMGTDFKVEVRAAAGGKAKATCKSCHSRDLKTAHDMVPEVAKSEYGESIGCGECHNDTRSNGLAQVKAKWKQHRCEDCHVEKSSSPTHDTKRAGKAPGTSKLGCASTGRGCHTTADLHALHPDQPRDCSGAKAKGERVCHKLDAQADKPARACASGAKSCHPRYTNTTLTHKADDDAHDAGTESVAGVLVDPLTETATGCTDCHTRWIAVEHARPNTRLRVGGSACRPCHNRSSRTARVIAANWPDRDTQRACRDCHGTAGIPSPHARDLGKAHAGIELVSKEATGNACGRPSCHVTADLRLLHAKTGCTTRGCHQDTGDINGANKRACGGPKGGRGCHAGYSTLSGHSPSVRSHRGIERSVRGIAVRGYCASKGCHPTSDVLSVHSKCETAGCHVGKTKPRGTSCGGTPDQATCHPGFSAIEHFADHNAAREGTAKGVKYGVGANIGCFGCHEKDLVEEHSAVASLPVSGGGATSCRVCHTDPRDPGDGAYSDLASVTAAVKRADVRCIACHASGTASPSRHAAASPHKRVTGRTEQVAGFVWDDPAKGWKAAFDSPAGGGHNALPADAVGAHATVKFPVTEYESDNHTFAWLLPTNSGATTWLRPQNGRVLRTAGDMRSATVTCEDCHAIADAMRGPHGAAVQVGIDPDYSQTEYANPVRDLTSQFAARGTRRVICMKCHTLEYGSVAGASGPGGSPVHAQHAMHFGAPSRHPLRYGEKCVDCHVRIPHAWRSVRLLVRTIPGAGRPADAFPYVAKDYDGLAGMLLGDYDGSHPIDRKACATGGCHGYHSSSNHPEPSDVPAAEWWP